MRIIFLFFIVYFFKAEAQTSVLNIADSLFQNGNYSKAIQHYKSYNNQTEVYDKIAKAYSAIGNYDEALHFYKLGVNANSNNALVKYSYAKLLYKTKNFTEAANTFKDLIAIDNSNPNYHFELGLVLEKQKDSTARHKYRKTFTLDNSHQKAIFKIAKYHLIKRHHDSVHYYVDKGLKTYENNLELISLNAQNFYWQQEYEKAAIWFEKLLAMDETSEFIYEKLSLSYAQIYEFEKAIKYRGLALQYNPLDAVGIYVIGTYYEKLQDFEKAEEYIGKALKMMDTPLNGEYRRLATIFNQQKKYKEAIAALKTAIKEDPKDQLSHFFMAMTKTRYYKDYEARIKALEDFKNKFPESTFAGVINGQIKHLKEEQFTTIETKTD
ncbi:MAG: tetratricopeptide repeat protein [Jejuia sp.]